METWVASTGVWTGRLGGAALIFALVLPRHLAPSKGARTGLMRSATGSKSRCRGASMMLLGMIIVVPAQARGSAHASPKPVPTTIRREVMAATQCRRPVVSASIQGDLRPPRASARFTAKLPTRSMRSAKARPIGRDRPRR